MIYPMPRFDDFILLKSLLRKRMTTFITYFKKLNIKAYVNITFSTCTCSNYYGYGLLSFLH